MCGYKRKHAPLRRSWTVFWAWDSCRKRKNVLMDHLSIIRFPFGFLPKKVFIFSVRFNTFSNRIGFSRQLCKLIRTPFSASPISPTLSPFVYNFTRSCPLTCLPKILRFRGNWELLLVPAATAGQLFTFSACHFLADTSRSPTRHSNPSLLLKIIHFTVSSSLFDLLLHPTGIVHSSVLSSGNQQERERKGH